MTSNVELLPLPKPLPRVLVHVLHEGDMELEAVGNYYDAEQVRACVSSATEALRAEVDSWKELQAYTHDTSVRVGDLLEAAEARAERLAEALREVSDVELWSAYDVFCANFIGMNTQASLRAAINNLLDSRAALHPTAAQEGNE